MLLTWGNLALTALVGAVAWFWRSSLQVRAQATVAAVAACERLGLQFLDGTVAFARLQLIRDGGLPVLRRTYVFDYTAQSIDRSQGFVLMRGWHLESVGFARNEHMAVAQAERPQHGAAHSAPALPTASGKVLDLEQWRRTNRDN